MPTHTKVSESRRVREVHKFLRAWQEVQVLLHGSAHESPLTGASVLRSHETIPQASSDKALTAFAQLATLRLNATRTMISLIDSDTQYILAEATQTISLMSASRYDHGDQLSYGETMVRCARGLCWKALNSSIVLPSDLHGHVSADAFVLSNALEDARFGDNELVQQQKVRFFASVPIITSDGIKIGAYSVMSHDFRHDLTHSEYAFLRDVASTVSEHLVLVKGRLSSARGARMVQGLTDFIAHEPRKDHRAKLDSRGGSIGGEALRRDSIDSEDDSSHSNTRPSPENIKDQFRSTPIPKESGKAASFPAEPLQNQSSPDIDATFQPILDHRTISTLEEDLKNMFARAAKSIFDSTEADGCVFLEASLQDSRGSESEVQEREQNHRPRESTKLHTNLQEGEETYASSVESHTETHSESDRSYLSDASATSGQVSNVLGIMSRLNEDHEMPLFRCTEHDLRRCIRRYPNGKVFNFNEQGTISSGDDTMSDHSQAISPLDTETVPPVSSRASRHKKVYKGRIRKFVALELIKIIPGSKSVLFLPLWDFHNEKWYAGLFLWTTEIGRSLDMHEELLYIRAFGNTIMTEVSRLTAMNSERAKTTFLASISHELRSPLHGIIGSVEFMADTKLDSFQRGLIGSMEMCSRTLLDTVDHVLDHAKINYFGSIAAHNNRSKGFHPKRPRNHRYITHANQENAFDICILVEEVVEAIFAGRTFKQGGTGTRANIFNRQASFEALDDSLKDQRSRSSHVEQKSRRFSDGVSIILDLDTNVDYTVLAQPGALRRVVMNLFGNALKYTERGMVTVSLRKTDHHGVERPGFVPMELIVSDTGQGISADFLQNNLYSPFSQEDPFSVGTGLGLSIVHQIVTAMDGSIKTNSKKGSGTQIKVNLDLQVVEGSRGHAKNVAIDATTKLMHNRRICILEPTPIDSELNQCRDSMVAALRKLFAEWFGMEVVSASNMDEKEADFYVYPEPPSIEPLIAEHESRDKRALHRAGVAPLIIICTNPFEEAALKVAGIDRLTSLGCVIEIISQPCGPMKLGRAFESSLRNMRKASETSRSASDASTSSLKFQQSRLDNEASDLISAAETASQPSSMSDGKTQQHVTLGNLESKVEHENRSKDESPKQMAMQDNVLTQTAAPPESSSRSPRDDKRVSTSGSSGPRVLVVDDNAVNLQLLVAFMKKLSLSYSRAMDGLEALNIYKEHFDAGTPFDFVLMDISMPVMDGLTSTQEIRRFEAQKNGSKAIVIALTGLAGQSVQEQAFKNGFDHFFSKPVRFKELSTLLAIEQPPKEVTSSNKLDQA